MEYIVRITENGRSDYIAEGNTYYINGTPYVPITSRFDEAKRYKSKKLADRASLRRGENIRGDIDIIEIDIKGGGVDAQ